MIRDRTLSPEKVFLGSSCFPNDSESRLRNQVSIIERWEVVGALGLRTECQKDFSEASLINSVFSHGHLANASSFNLHCWLKHPLESWVTEDGKEEHVRRQESQLPYSREVT